jgi:hypothetical protein
VDAPSQEQVEKVEKGFPPEYQSKVDGLLWLGYLEDSFAYGGHHFRIRTLKVGEELEAALLAKEYLESLGAVRANSTSQLAAAIISVDNDTNFCPSLGPNPQDALTSKFQYICQKWHWPVVEYIFNKYIELLNEQAQALKRLEDLSTRSQITSWPSLDSLTEPAISQAT